jgi:hypothetical protein
MVRGHTIIISEVSLRFHENNTVFCQKKGTLSERTHKHCYHSADTVATLLHGGPAPRILEGGALLLLLLLLPLQERLLITETLFYTCA